jgi:hypothetical protein
MNDISRVEDTYCADAQASLNIRMTKTQLNFCMTSHANRYRDDNTVTIGHANILLPKFLPRRKDILE